MQSSRDRVEREGHGVEGRERERGWDRLIRHDRIRLGASSSIILTKLAHRNTRLDGCIEEGEEVKEGKNRDMFIHFDYLL